MSDALPTAIVVGVGAATGKAVCYELSKDHQVAMVARSVDTIEPLQQELDRAHAFQCDVSDLELWSSTLDRIEEELGLPEVVIFNTEGGGMGRYDQIDLQAFNNSFPVVVTSLLCLAQKWIPRAIESGKSLKLIINSSPIAFEMKQRYTGLGPARWAQRYLGEVLRESTRDESIDIALLSIDGAIDEPRMRQLLPDRKDSEFIQPVAIAKKIKAMLDSKTLAFQHEIRAQDYTGV